MMHECGRLGTYGKRHATKRGLAPAQELKGATELSIQVGGLACRQYAAWQRSLFV